MLFPENPAASERLKVCLDPEMNNYPKLLRSIYANRRWICCGGVVMEGVATGGAIRNLGGESLALGATRGAGDIPDRTRVVDLDLGAAPDMMTSMHRAEAAMGDLPTWAREKIDAFDSTGDAHAIMPVWGSLPNVAGRRVFGARDPRWMALEDKTRADAVWDAAGVTRAPSRIVDLTRDALLACWDELDRGDGVVVAFDNSDGWHGAAEGTRWIRSRDRIDDALDGSAKTARAMPFLEGLPCSIHGWVVGGTVVTLRPVEMIVLRKRGTARFHYAQAASFWDAPADLTEEMRNAARAVGQYLRDSVGYRGVFTVDGIATEQGFLPTELNPRFGAALNVLTRAIPDFPTYLLHLASVEQDLPGLDPALLEDDILRASTEHRAGSGLAMSTIVREPDHIQLDYRDGAWAIADREKGDANALVGPNPVGSIVLFRMNRSPMAPGAPVGGCIADALAFLGKHWGLGLDDLEAAPAAKSQ